MKLPSISQFPLPVPSGASKAGIVLGSLFLGQWVLTDLIHLPGGGLGIALAGVGYWWLAKPSFPKFESPSTVNGWVKRCKEVLDQFQGFEEDSSQLANPNREEVLQTIIDRTEPQKIAFVCSAGVDLPNKSLIEEAISGSYALALSLTSTLPLNDKSWAWPKSLFEEDLLVYFLPTPLRAVDMLWLEKVPEDQPSWVMVQMDNSENWEKELKALQAQLPTRWSKRILQFSNEEEDIRLKFNSVRKTLEETNRNIDLTKQRLLSKLHCSWQSELESLRRNKFRNIQQRNQWIVAGAVIASPVPSTDLLSLAVVNGLMIQEMAKIWSCPLEKEVLQVVAKHLAGAAIAQGVVEWTGQALLGVAKLHGTSWLAAGTLQAISAAYLTRVVGRSMADWMALNNGVTELDLEALKKQAPQLISNAAKEERVDWAGFLKQANIWLEEKTVEPIIHRTIIDPA